MGQSGKEAQRIGSCCRFYPGLSAVGQFSVTVSDGVEAFRARDAADDLVGSDAYAQCGHAEILGCLGNFKVRDHRLNIDPAAFRMRFRNDVSVKPVTDG